MGPCWDYATAIIPNQALYQAEPQPELIPISRTPVGDARPYFAYFAASGKRSNFKRDAQLASSCRTSKTRPVGGR